MVEVNKEEIENRIKKLQQKLVQADIDLALLVQNVDLYYFSGTSQAEYLCIPRTGEPILLGRRGMERIKKESSLEKIISFTRSGNIPEILAQEGICNYNNLGLELDVLSYKQAAKLQDIFAVKRGKLVSITHLIREVRMIKSESELKLIRKAAKQLEAIPKLVQENLREGISELELSSIIEDYLRKSGHIGVIRMRGLNNELPLGICAAEDNALVPLKSDALCGGSGLTPAFGVGPSQKKIKKGEAVTLDYVANYKGYYIDQTRIAVLEEADFYLKELYLKMKEIQERLSQHLVPGNSWESIYQQGLELARELGVDDYYLGSGDNQVRFVGHGIGLELNEYPFLAAGLDFKLQAGMVVALEPKLLVPQVGGVGIENTYLITDKKPEKLTNCTEELIVV